MTNHNCNYTNQTTFYFSSPFNNQILAKYHEIEERPILRWGLTLHEILENRIIHTPIVTFFLRINFLVWDGFFTYKVCCKSSIRSPLSFVQKLLQLSVEHKLNQVFSQIAIQNYMALSTCFYLCAFCFGCE